MTSSEIVRSWKDEDYQSRRQGAETAFLPANPAGLIELSDDELLGVDGAIPTPVVTSALVSASAGAVVSVVVTVAAITIYKLFTS